MTPRDTALLQSCIDWMRDAANRATASGREQEAMGLLRGAAKLEAALTEETE